MYAFGLMLLTVPSAPPPHNAAELLLLDVDAKIVAAKSLRIEFTIDESTGGKEDRLTQGTLIVADHNRFFCEMTGTFKARVISDGKQMVIVEDDPSTKKSQVAPEWFNDFLQRSLGRGGTFVSFARALDYAKKSGAPRPGTNGGPQVADAKLQPAEEVNGIKAQVIDYELTWPKTEGDADQIRARVWIDPKTNLPLRRTMSFLADTEKKSFTAIHTKFELNPKLDNKLFELPK